MTDRKSVSDKVDALGVGLSDTVHDLMREARPMLHQATDRMTERVSEMAQHGVDAARSGKREMQNQAHDLSDHAAHMIRHEPFKAMLIAAGVGAAVVALIGVMSRPHPHPHSH